MANYQIALFTFTLSGDRSIGPTALTELWMRACGTSDVGVDRKESHREGRPVYTLYASRNLADLQGVETRLRTLLESAHLNASISPVYR
ncbi:MULTISPECIES: hypothetical protein [Luteimonas]|uniref:30S ribosomal protein S6 n=1 Tax=Luteimonas viscosa TaxID=1132694 RepID=A0A5D4XG15_9GAMM|nr:MULTISPECIES: hypothetical protein [Luteimonas]TYT23558.1 hypothetical protein FZO89_14995 [Luteimonas viscosa]